MGIQPHPLRNFLGQIWAKFRQNLVKFGQIWAKFVQFGQYLNLLSLKDRQSLFSRALGIGFISFNLR